MCPRSSRVQGGDRSRRLDLQIGEDLALRSRKRRRLLNRPRRSLEPDQLDPLQLGADLSPTLPALALDDPAEQQRQPADQDVGADPVLEAVEDGADRERSLEVAEAALGLEQVLVAEGGVLGTELGIAGLQQVLAVEPLLGLDPGAVELQPTALRLAQVTRVDGVVAQRALGPLVGDPGLE